MFLHNNKYWAAYDHIAVSCLPKTGHTSIQEVLYDAEMQTNEAVKCVPLRVAWIRNPLTRLVSSYSFFKAMKERGSKVDKDNDIYDYVSSYENYVDHSLEVDDSHWGPQVEMLTENGEWIPTIAHRFEDINTLWGKYFKGFIPHTNGCVHEPSNDYRRADLELKYKEDIELWRGL